MSSEPASAGPPVRMWLAEPLAPECRKAVERLGRIEGVRRIAVLPDVHGGSEGSGLGAGVALATARLLIPQAVGADIGCGMSTCRLGLYADAIADKETAMTVLSAVRRAVPIIRHNHRTPPVLPDTCNGGLLSDALRSALARDGARRRDRVRHARTRQPLS